RPTGCYCEWSSDVCSSDLARVAPIYVGTRERRERSASSLDVVAYRSRRSLDLCGPIYVWTRERRERSATTSRLDAVPSRSSGSSREDREPHGADETRSAAR